MALTVLRVRNMQRNGSAGWRHLSPLLALALLRLACRNFDVADSTGASGQTSGGAEIGGGGSGESSQPAAGAGGDSDGGAGGIPEFPSAGAGGGSEGGAPLRETLKPADFERLALWLDATAEDCSIDSKQKVVQWLDHSGNGNDANADPQFAMPTFTQGVVNGHAALHFLAQLNNNLPDEPSLLVVRDSNSLQFGNEDFAYLVVARNNNSVQPRAVGLAPTYIGSGVLLSKQDSFLPYRGVALLCNYPSNITGSPAYSRFGIQLEAGGALTLSYSDQLNDSLFRLYVARRSGADLAVRINGAAEGVSRVASDLDASAARRNLLIGGVSTQPFVGDIAELAVIRGHVADPDLAAIERYFLGKYALE